jgi:hypothetical protein
MKIDTGAFLLFTNKEIFLVVQSKIRLAWCNTMQKAKNYAPVSKLKVGYPENRFIGAACQRFIRKRDLTA